MIVGKKLQDREGGVWELVRRQHGVVARAQLLELGVRSCSIEHRVAKGRLHPLWRGVYAVGRPEVSQNGRWMGAVLACGSKALLSHTCAAALWRIAPPLRAEAIHNADRFDLVDVEALRAAIAALPPRPGMACMRRLLGLDALTDTGLERKFLAIVQAANLPIPETQIWVSGYRVDFYWPALGLVVEADGWRHHRTPGEQRTDRRRDQAHLTSGLTTLRFSEDQIRFRPAEVRRPLVAVIARLS